MSGPPHPARNADPHSSASRAERAKADAADPNQIAAPMPGAVALVAVAAGQSVKAGDTLMTLEAMKMETPITAARDATVDTVLVRVGQSVEAKDLLMTIK